MIAVGSIIAWRIGTQPTFGVVIAAGLQSPRDLYDGIRFHLVQGDYGYLMGHNGNAFGFPAHPHARGDMRYLWEYDRKVATGGSPNRDYDWSVDVVGSHITAGIYLSTEGTIQRLPFKPLPRHLW